MCADRRSRYVRLALALGDAIKWDVSVRRIGRAAQGTLGLEEPTSHPNPDITSERAQYVYDWVLSLLEMPLEPDLADQHLRAFVSELCREMPEGALEPRDFLALLAEPAAMAGPASADLGLLHPLVRNAAEALVAGGHYDQAVFEAFKRLELLVRERSGLGDLSGRALMFHAFDATTPMLALGDLTTPTGRDRQEGLKFLLGGAMQAIRNVAAHGDLGLDAASAHEHLTFASLLVRMVEAARRTTPEDQ